MAVRVNEVSARIICNKKCYDFRANLRTEFEGELPYTGNMDTSPKRKSSVPLMAGETKTSVMRQEMNSGKGVSHFS